MSIFVLVMPVLRSKRLINLPMHPGKESCTSISLATLETSHETCLRRRKMELNAWSNNHLPMLRTRPLSNHRYEPESSSRHNRNRHLKQCRGWKPRFGINDKGDSMRNTPFMKRKTIIKLTIPTTSATDHQNSSSIVYYKEGINKIHRT